MTSTQDLYQNAIRFAAEKHKGQTVNGLELPYVVHLSNVAMEILVMAMQAGYSTFDLSFAVQVALLHDTIEDTNVSFEEIKKNFSTEIADAVMALTKDEALPKEQRMPDTISRIKKFRKEVWAVKLADRITNMQKPPDGWSPEKRKAYLAEAQMIYEEFHEGNELLAERLRNKMDDYKKFL